MVGALGRCGARRSSRPPPRGRRVDDPARGDGCSADQDPEHEDPQDRRDPRPERVDAGCAMSFLGWGGGWRRRVVRGGGRRRGGERELGCARSFRRAIRARAAPRAHVLRSRDRRARAGADQLFRHAECVLACRAQPSRSCGDFAPSFPQSRTTMRVCRWPVPCGRLVSGAPSELRRGDDDLRREDACTHAP